MRTAPRLHCLRLPFQVTPEIERFVNVGIIEGEKLCLVDTGVAGSFASLADYLDQIGRKIGETGAILLTHSHPDHIGCAARCKRISGCRVVASASERMWIEKIETQFAARPVPNFFALAGESVTVDVIAGQGDVLRLEPGISMEVLETPGHSQGSLCYYWQEGRTLFTGDAVPVPGDIPIYDSSGAAVASLEKLLAFPGVEHYVPSWDTPCGPDKGLERLRAGLALLRALAEEAARQSGLDPDPESLAGRVAKGLGLTAFADNPLFRRTVLSHIDRQEG